MRGLPAGLPAVHARGCVRGVSSRGSTRHSPGPAPCPRRSPSRGTTGRSGALARNFPLIRHRRVKRVARFIQLARTPTPPPTRIENNRTIELDRFLLRDQIDPRYYNTPYYIAPRDQVG